ncbi:hypothetical protein SAY87_010575 [Trapa incisa]|uniref:PPM-type phosphatase domain-containing protein n=1 Tax=Trapa incisa TaxID=236973 RepID=A0AAN7JIH4_9MYRT|nr:hypothetical protein SAY87_010575 [Trapa incisa]
MGACCSTNKEYFAAEDLEPQEWESDEEEEIVEEGDCGAKIRLKGSSSYVSVFSKQGKKGVNQDAMTVWEDFTGEKGTHFCGVFDGHGPCGHDVARSVRDKLPYKLSSAMKLSQVKESNPDLDLDLSQKGETGDESNESDKEQNGSSTKSPHEDSDNTSMLLSLWEAGFIRAFDEMDKELNSNPAVDCFCSGTTAVSIVRSGEHLMIANLGDSRAVLCTRGQKNQLVPVQLTVDLKPNIPSEAERIRKCKGRVFAIDHEPEVQRIWMPEEDCPGLAMSRAFGDFCLKNYGLVSFPDLSYRKIMPNDEFVVLATDGIWDVLTNDEVIMVVSSVRNRSLAAKVLVARAVQAWKTKYPGCKVDDCAVVCLFFKDDETLDPTDLNVPKGQPKARGQYLQRPSKGKVDASSAVGKSDIDSNLEWNALDGVTRVNSLLKLPRLSNLLHRKKAPKSQADSDVARSISVLQ